MITISLPAFTHVCVLLHLVIYYNHFFLLSSKKRTMLTLPYLSHTIGRLSCCMDRREEHACRGGGAMGAEFSWQPILRAASVLDKDNDDDDDEGAGVSASTGQWPFREWFPLVTAVEFGTEISGAMAPCGTSMATACSASRVGEDGGEGRSFFLFVNSFNRPFFSL